MKIRASRLVLIFFLSSVVWFSQCTNRNNSTYLPLSDEKLIAVLVDIQVAEALVEGEIPVIHDSILRSYYPQIFTRHGIVAADFDTTMSRLTRQSGRLEKIYRKVSAELLKTASGQGGLPEKK